MSRILIKVFLLTEFNYNEAVMTRTDLIGFCLRSLWREYGIAFVARVVIRHPLLSWARLKDYLSRPSGEQGRDRRPENLTVQMTEGKMKKVLVGLGFCLKPLDPECPSERPNHDCAFFDRYDPRQTASVAPACRICQIRELGLAALQSGCCVYIMTSAKDILADVLLPVLEEQRFKAALLALCRYSFAPFEIALELVGLDARLIPYAGGDCRDYRMWRRADKGIKEDQTRLDTQEKEDILVLLDSSRGKVPLRRVCRTGNIYHLCERPESTFSGGVSRPSRRGSS